jgi:hypothetical protein
MCGKTRRKECFSWWSRTCVPAVLVKTMPSMHGVCGVEGAASSPRQAPAPSSDNKITRSFIGLVLQMNIHEA